MDAKRGAAAAMYEDFVPSSELVQEGDCDTLLLYLPGFNKEQLRVQLTRGILRISGSRPLGHNKWRRFQKEFLVSANCDTNQITARFEGGILYVIQPKMITPADKQDQMLPASKASESEKPADEPQAQKNFQEQANEKTSQTDVPTKQTGGNNVPEKAQERVEQKTANGKSNGSADVKKGEETSEEKKTSFPEKSSEEKESSNEDKEKKTSDKPKTDSINAAENKDKATTGNEDGSDKPGLASYGEIARGMAARLKLPGRLVNLFLAVLLALVLGLYVSNWIISPRKAEN